MHIFLTISLALLLLTACGKDDGPKNVDNISNSPDCVFPDSPDNSAPSWVCDEPVKGIEVSTVGIAEPTKAGISYQKQQAETDGRVRMAQRIRTRVQNLIKQYAETTGIGDSQTVDRVNSSVTRQLTNQELVGSRLYTSLASPNGALYVLMGIDKDSVNNLLEDALDNSINDDSAVWQKIQAGKAHDELVEEILQQ